MDKVRIFYDQTANSLVVWFKSPQKEFVASEIEDDTILMKDKDGKVIGLEKLNYLPAGHEFSSKEVPVEVFTSN